MAVRAGPLHRSRESHLELASACADPGNGRTSCTLQRKKKSPSCRWRSIRLTRHWTMGSAWTSSPNTQDAAGHRW